MGTDKKEFTVGKQTKSTKDYIVTAGELRIGSKVVGTGKDKKVVPQLLKKRGETVALTAKQAHIHRFSVELKK